MSGMAEVQRFHCLHSALDASARPERRAQDRRVQVAPVDGTWRVPAVVRHGQASPGGSRQQEASELDAHRRTGFEAKASHERSRGCVHDASAHTHLRPRRPLDDQDTSTGARQHERCHRTGRSRTNDQNVHHGALAPRSRPM
jgi:hypothetical protein